MDKRPLPGPARRPRPSPRPAPVSFTPDRRYTALAAGAAVGAVLALLITSDPGGRLIAGTAAVLLAGYVTGDLYFSPRLTATSTGIRVNAPLTRRTLTWDEIVEVRADTRMRHGLRSTNLEIDADPVLVVLSPRALGADPVLAADLIAARRPS